MHAEKNAYRIWVGMLEMKTSLGPKCKENNIKMNFKVGCLHPVACTRSGSGFPSSATLF
jgi:hypothetical protein